MCSVLPQHVVLTLKLADLNPCPSTENKANKLLYSLQKKVKRIIYHQYTENRYAVKGKIVRNVEWLLYQSINTKGGELLYFCDEPLFLYFFF